MAVANVAAAPAAARTRRTPAASARWSRGTSRSPKPNATPMPRSRSRSTGSRSTASLAGFSWANQRDARSSARARDLHGIAHREHGHGALVGRHRRGVPVSGYLVSGGRWRVSAQPDGRAVRARADRPLGGGTKTLFVTVTPQSRAGYPPVPFPLVVPPPGRQPAAGRPSTQRRGGCSSPWRGRTRPGLPGARARFVGPVTLRAGATRPAACRQGRQGRSPTSATSGGCATGGGAAGAPSAARRAAPIACGPPTAASS